MLLEEEGEFKVVESLDIHTTYLDALWAPSCYWCGVIFGSSPWPIITDFVICICICMFSVRALLGIIVEFIHII